MTVRVISSGGTLLIDWSRSSLKPGAVFFRPRRQVLEDVPAVLAEFADTAGHGNGAPRCFKTQLDDVYNTGIDATKNFAGRLISSAAEARQIMNEQAFPLQIDIVSDVVCPWCIIGYKQLQKALDGQPGRFDVTLRWHPFELNPHMPPEGQNLREHLAHKYGTTVEQSRAARGRLTELGASLGFRFDYFDDMRMVNTFKAHQLLHWAGEQGRQTELKLALFSAFFSERRDVSDAQVLVAVAQSQGLSAQEAADLLADERYATAVRSEQQHWLDREVHAVPTFLFNGRYQVPGAQEAATFTRVLNRIVESAAA